MLHYFFSFAFPPFFFFFLYGPRQRRTMIPLHQDWHCNAKQKINIFTHSHFIFYNISYNDGTKHSSTKTNKKHQGLALGVDPDMCRPGGPFPNDQ